MGWTTGEERRGEAHVAGALVGLLGLLLVGVQIRHLLEQGGLVSILVESAFSLSLAVVLVGVGYAVARGAVVDEADALRFAGWVAAGAAIFLFTGAWILALDVVLGYATPGRLLVTTNAVTLGAVVGVIVGLYDARNREQTRRLRERERRLIRQNRQLDEFVSVVSHDLRNPLNVAVARVELAREEYDSEHLADAARAHDRMAALIEDLLSLARQSDEGIDAEPLDLAATVEECWRNVDTTGSTLVVDTDRVVRADRSQLTRLFENLLRNSVEHSSTGSRTESGDSVEHSSTGSRPAADDSVEHSSTDNRPPADDSAEHGSTDHGGGTADDRPAGAGAGVTVTVGDCADGFYVADDGPGIPDAERERVFESGYSTTTDGTGFGLRIIRGIADAHGWEIDVTEGDEGGVRFEITGVEFAE